jgi:hypothetical protein
MTPTNYLPTQDHSAQVHSQLIHAQVVDFIDKSPNSPNSPKVKRKAHKRHVTPKGVHLQLIGNGSPDKFIGVHAVPGRLPELLRYPGETAQAFCARALHAVTGTGAFVAMLMYASDSATPPSRIGAASMAPYPPVMVPLKKITRTGNAQRENGLFHGAPKGVI